MILSCDSLTVVNQQIIAGLARQNLPKCQPDVFSGDPTLFHTVAHNCHGNNKYLTAKPKMSRQNQIPHGKTKMLTAITNSSQQNQNARGKTKKLTAN